VTGVFRPGGAALVPIEWLREINNQGRRPGELAVLLDELDRSGGKYRHVGVPDDTGLPRNQEIIPANQPTDLGFNGLRSILPTVLTDAGDWLGFNLVKCAGIVRTAGCRRG